MSQVIDLDEITFNPKKAAVVAGAFVFADVVSALLTGRSVLRIINGNEDPEDWKTKVRCSQRRKARHDTMIPKLLVVTITMARLRFPACLRPKRFPSVVVHSPPSHHRAIFLYAPGGEQAAGKGEGGAGSKNGSDGDDQLGEEDGDVVVWRLRKV